MIARALLAAAITLALAAPPVTANAPHGFIGVSAEEVFWQGAEQETNLALMQANGITELRQIIRWTNIEKQQGVYDWSLYDRVLVNAARHNLRVLPIVGGEVPWATSRPAGDTRNCLFPPRDNATFTAFLRLVVERYGPGGTLWQQNPGLASFALTRWQVWNEANTDTFWGCKKNAKAYMKLAKASANTIRSIDPDAAIITTGAPNKAGGDFLRTMFKNGAKNVFNALAMHPYKKNGDAVLKEMRQARSLLNELGAKGWKLRITEFGWATSGPPEKPHTTDEAGQAKRVKNTLLKLAAARSELKLKSMDYYQWRSVDPMGGHDYWGLHTGLLRVDGSPKPALAKVAEASREID